MSRIIEVRSRWNPHILLQLEVQGSQLVSRKWWKLPEGPTLFDLMTEEEREQYQREEQERQKNFLNMLLSIPSTPSPSSIPPLNRKEIMERPVPSDWIKKEPEAKNFPLTAQGFTEEFERLFILFGRIESLDISGGTYDEVYQLIYSLPIPSEYGLKFIRLGYCGCNMGHCAEIINYEILDCSNLGDLFQEVGVKQKTNLMSHTYYEYPELVRLYIERIQKLEFVYEGSSCYGKKVATGLDLSDPNINYYGLGYSR